MNLSTAAAAALLASVIAAECGEKARPAPDDTTRAAETARAPTSSAPTNASAEVAASASLPPLSSEWLIALGDPKKPFAYVSPPSGATTKRPVVVAVHGAGDRPDWACAGWRAIAGPYPFIVCPGGVPHPAWKDTFVWSSSAHVEKAMALAMEATSARFGAYVAEGPRVFTGFSQGSVLGASIVQKRSDLYPFAVFQEGLGDVSSPAFAKAFRTGGGKRIVLGCSQGGCAAPREAAKEALARHQVEARVNDAGPIGHTLEPRVVASLRKDFGWVVEGEPIWEAVVKDHGAEAR